MTDFENYSDLDFNVDELFSEKSDDNDNDFEEDTSCYDNFFINIDDKNQLKKQLEKNKESKNEVLELEGNNIDELPEDLKNYTWVKVLILESTNIKTITNNLPPNLNKFICKYSSIKSFDASVLPDCVTMLIFIHNNTSEITGLKEGLLEINLSDNIIRELKSDIPTTTIKLVMSHNKLLFTSPIIPDSVREYYINETSITNIDDLNDNIEILHTCRCNISEVNKLPSELIDWKCFVSQVEKINCKWPSKMKKLDLFNNLLEEIEELPESLVEADLSNNEFEEIPIFHSAAKSIDLKQNNKIKLEDFEELLKKFPSVNILYDRPKKFQTMNDMHFLNNFSPEYMFNHNNNAPIVSFSRFNDDDPNYVPLDKTYVL